MKLILLSIFFIISISLFLGYKTKKRVKSKENIPIKRYSINEWMLFSANERKRLDDELRLKTMKRKKSLLKDIRNEYINYKNTNQRRM